MQRKWNRNVFEYPSCHIEIKDIFSERGIRRVHHILACREEGMNDYEGPAPSARYFCTSHVIPGNVFWFSLLVIQWFEVKYRYTSHSKTFPSPLQLQPLSIETNLPHFFVYLDIYISWKEPSDLGIRRKGLKHALHKKRMPKRATENGLLSRNWKAWSEPYEQIHRGIRTRECFHLAKRWFSAPPPLHLRPALYSFIRNSELFIST